MPDYAAGTAPDGVPPNAAPAAPAASAGMGADAAYAAGIAPNHRICGVGQAAKWQQASIAAGNVGDSQVIPNGVRGRNLDLIELLTQMNQEVAMGIASLNNFCQARTNVARLVPKQLLQLQISITLPPLQTGGLPLQLDSWLIALRHILKQFSLIFEHFYITYTEDRFHAIIAFDHAFARVIENLNVFSNPIYINYIN